jgi:hypothetical protein
VAVLVNVQPCEGGGDNTKYIIIGSVIGGFLLLVILVVLVLFYILRYRQDSAFKNLFWSAESARLEAQL